MTHDNTLRDARLSRRAVLTALGLGGAALAGCTPGGTATPPASSQPATAGAVKTDPAQLGDVTLRIWDQEVRGGGKAQIEKLNAAFTQAYPTVKLERTTKSFDDLVKTVRLGLSGDNAPDVVQINNTRGDMGSYVKAKQLIPLDAYATAYGWDKRYPASVRAVTSYTPDAKTFGSGSLYGLPQVGEVVGIFVNKKKLKALGIAELATWADFEKALETAKGKGETPLDGGRRRRVAQGAGTGR